ncbi:hypothetical protein ILYODFUR_037113 [Ilyodon furcidens]|uniref:Myb/SANT-like DNA-binding domain-containing protein n=1 Tax=Ilyodon furcidens TaxID=33524 RepID=A0ABV0VBR0_9TELE
MAGQGYQQTAKQCRVKLKKLKSDYRTIKDHNGRSGSDWKNWKQFDQIDSIHGNRLASDMRESACDSATVELGSKMDDGQQEEEMGMDLSAFSRRCRTNAHLTGPGEINRCSFF